MRPATNMRGPSIKPSLMASRMPTSVNHVPPGTEMLVTPERSTFCTLRAEFSTLKSARSVQKVLRSGVTSISVPGGTWFTDVGIRDAIKLGLMEGPRMFVAGRMIVTYGCIEDDEPSWEGTPDHSIGKLCNTADEMVTEVRRQGKHGVNFIKMADSRSGE